MEFFGLFLLIVGGVLWFVRRHQHRRSRSLKLARATQISELQTVAAAVAQEIGGGDWRDYVVLWGTVQADLPLTSTFKAQPCVYYSSSVVREYEETVREQDAKGNWTTRTQRGSETISQEQQQTPFYLVDRASDQVLVNPEGAAIEAVEVLNEFRPGSPAGGQLSFGSFSLSLGDWGGGQRRTLGYRYRESVIAVGQSVTVLGMASDRTGTLTLEKPAQGGHPFLISPKSQESLTQAATRNAQIAFWAMVGCLGVGVLLLLWALVG
jgi:flagellar biogenesis protein FliO